MGEDRTATEQGPDRRRVTVAEASEILGITAEAVRTRIKRGKLSPHPATVAEECKNPNPGSVIIACLEKTASPTPAIAGQPLTFTITASIQNGATAVTGYVTDYLPTDVTFVSATSGQGTCVYDDFAHTVTCGPYGLNSENPDFAATTMTIFVTSNSPGTITNTTNGPYGLVASATVEVVERPTELQTKAECKNGGYDEFGFKNQGQCIKAVNATN